MSRVEDARVQRSGSPAEPSDFHATLLSSMHAMAQPITLLLSHFYLARVTEAGCATSAPLFADAARAVEELSTTFRLLQELIHLQSVAACVYPTPLSRILETLVDDAEAIFAASGTVFELRRELVCDRAAELGQTSPADRPMFFLDIDIERTRGAIAGILHVACAAAKLGSTVVCNLSFDQTSVVLKFKPLKVRDGAAHRCFDEQTWLKLAIAKAYASGPGTSFHVTPRPFVLSIRLPLARVSRTDLIDLPAGLAKKLQGNRLRAKRREPGTTLASFVHK